MSRGHSGIFGDSDATQVPAVSKFGCKGTKMGIAMEIVANI